jgi:O-antigen/teichoic acid export membrane protein
LSDNIEEKVEETAETTQKPKSQIIRNVLVNWTAFVVVLLTGFWMAPFLIKHLGESVYGVWILTGSLVGYLGLLDFGVTQSTVKYIAEYRAKNDQNAINRVITGSFYVFSIVGAFSLLISLFFALFFNRLFNTPLPDSTVAIVVGLVGINIAVTFPCSVFLGVLRGYQRYDIGAAANSVSVLVRSGFIVWAVLNNYGIIALAAITLVFDMARLAFVIQRVYKINPEIRIAREFFHRDELGKLFGHSVWMFLIMVGDQVNFYTDAVLIGLFLPTAAITVYSIAFRLIGYLRSMVVEMVGVLMPAVSSMHAQEDSKGIGDLLTAGAKFTLILALPAAVVFVLLGDRFIELWIGKDNQQSALLLSILTVGIVAHLCEMAVTTVLIGTGRAYIVARWVIAQSVVNLILSLILIKQMGLVGVALGTSISMVGFAVVSIPIYFHHHLKQSLSAFVRRALFLPLAIQIPWVAAIYLLREFVPMHSLSGFFTPILLLAPFYGAVVFAVCLSPSEKAAVAGKFGFKRFIKSTA